MAKKNDSLGDRMKGYESVSRNFAKRYLPLNVLCLCLIMTKYWTS